MAPIHVIAIPSKRTWMGRERLGIAARNHRCPVALVHFSGATKAKSPPVNQLKVPNHQIVKNMNVSIDRPLEFSQVLTDIQNPVLF
jgi:hypothetical protein